MDRLEHLCRRPKVIGGPGCGDLHGVAGASQWPADVVQRSHPLFLWLLILLAALLLLAGRGCGREAQETREIRVWINEPDRGLQAVFREWERRNPGWRVTSSFYQGGMDAQKLLTAIAGGDPPQVVIQDRFTIGEWASRDALLPLGELVARSDIDPADFYPSAWNEASYRGEVYAIPFGVDDRALYFNTDLLREAGFVDAEGNVVPPRNWMELRRYAVALTKRDEDGNITQLGFAPNYGNSWLYLYAWLNGGEFLSEDGRTVTLDDEANVEALEYMVELYDAVGGMDAANSFLLGTTGLEVDPFLTGRVAMKIDGNFFLPLAAEYAPDLEFGVAPPPAPTGRDPVTWSGGFSFVIPAGAEHAQEAFDLIRLLVSDEGYELAHKVRSRYALARGRGYIPVLAARPAVNERLRAEYVERSEVLSPSVKEGMAGFLELMPVARYRPVTPVGQLLWDEHVRAIESAARHRGAPAEVLKEATQEVQRRLDRLMREQDGVMSGPRVHWGWVGGVAGTVLIGAVALFLWLARRLRPNDAKADEVRAAVGFLSPWLIGFFGLMAGPMLASLIFSFCRYDVLHPATWAGLANYRRLIVDELFWYSLANTAYMLLAVPLGLVVGLGIALLLNAEVRGMKVYRTLFYLPAVTPVVAASILWLWVLNPESGLINSSLRQLGLSDLPLWLASPSWLLGSKAAILLMLLWGAGSGMIIWLAGLKGIPRHLYEAAEIDGAGPVRRFLSVTLPMLTPYIFFNLVIGLIGTMQIFTQAYVMTQGGPADSTLFYAYYLFNSAFRYFEMGYASALAWVLLLIILFLTLLQIWGSRRWVHYEAVG